MVQRKRSRTRREDYNEHHIAVLLKGRALIPMAVPELYANQFDALEGLDKDAVRQVWENLRDELLPQYIEEHPGQRPAAWWWFEAPEPARRLLSGVSPLEEPDASESSKRLSYGITNVYGLMQAKFPVVWESQAAYLQRHGLLGEDEAARLTPEDFEPEAPMGITPHVFGKSK